MILDGGVVALFRSDRDLTQRNAVDTVIGKQLFRRLNDLDARRDRCDVTPPAPLRSGIGGEVVHTIAFLSRQATLRKPLLAGICGIAPSQGQQHSVSAV
ncbi:hypothetical protein SAMN06296065_106142 [Novosphingobium panipatense]|uniref:Uncharacterized protein n=1 Tax=Novosphingobium panipatense TaxID=428991 RepID=A0ABY1QIU5_9SPHN|nr:hypothetical protein SAMN06296065_106142 [Novosphingobium panipatense]